MTQRLSHSCVLFCEYHKHPWSVCPILLKVVPFHDCLKTFAKYVVPSSSLSTLLMQPSKLRIVLLCTCKCCKLCVLPGYLVEGKLFSCIAKWHYDDLAMEHNSTLNLWSSWSSPCCIFALLSFQYMPLACNLKRCKVWNMIFVSFLFGFLFCKHWISSPRSQKVVQFLLYFWTCNLWKKYGCSRLMPLNCLQAITLNLFGLCGLFWGEFLLYSVWSVSSK